MQSLTLGRQQTLYLDNCRILLQAQWPLLASLDFSMTRSFGDRFVDFKEVAKGVWPSVAYLSFRDCDLVLDTCPGNFLQALTAADWPKLQTLDLSENKFSPEVEGMPINVITLVHQRWPTMSLSYGCNKTDKATCNVDTICHRSRHLVQLPAIQFVMKLGQATGV